MRASRVGSVDPFWLVVFTDPVRLTVLRHLHDLGTATVTELSTGAHTSSRTLRRHLDALVALGIVHEVDDEREGVRPGRPPNRFLLDPDVRQRLEELFALLAEPLAP